MKFEIVNGLTHDGKRIDVRVPARIRGNYEHRNYRIGWYCGLHTAEYMSTLIRYGERSHG